MHAVPPPMTGNYMPSGPDIEIDDSKFTYGPKQPITSESETNTSDFSSCESESSVESLECLPEQVVKEPKVACELKVWTDAPIIEEYESDSDDDCVSIPLKETEQPSFAVDSDKHVKTSRENVKDKHTHSQYLKVNKKDLNESKRVGLGYCFTRRACFVCGSFSHLIRDCDYHEKRMAKQVELNKQKMAKGNGSGESKPKWNNVQRMNHQNQFVPTVVLTRTGRIPVNTTRPSSTNKVSTARQNSSQAVLAIHKDSVIVYYCGLYFFVLCGLTFCSTANGVEDDHKDKECSQEVLGYNPQKLNQKKLEVNNLGDDASKQGRINDIVADEDTTLIRKLIIKQLKM
ncbi:hypothetical protein Tco_1089402 [Tanacetum coccineum]